MFAAALAVAASVSAPSTADRALLLRDFRAAAAAYAREAQAVSGEARRRARYGEALARLSAGEAEAARKVLAPLAADAEAGAWRDRARASLGDALLAAGRHAEAVEAYRDYLVFAPGGEEAPWVYVQAARTLRAARRTAEAASFEAEVGRRWPRLGGRAH